MASPDSTSKLPKSTTRRSLPVPSTRTPSAQPLHLSSQSVSSISRIVRPSQVPSPSHAAASSISSAKSKPHAHCRRDSPANSNIGKLSIAPRAQESCRPLSSSTATSPTTVYGLFTPAKATGHGKEHLSAPKGPVQTHRADFATPAQTPSKKAPSPSPYANAHVADACVPGSLIHQLSPCGHKVMTTKPEPCASNCRRPISQEAMLAFTNIPQSSEPFVCAACVELHVQSHRDMKRSVFADLMDKTELRMGGGYPAGWREAQSLYWQRVWDNDAQAERARFETLGRKSGYIPGEPIQDGEVQETAVFTSAPAPWPPVKRPLATRRSDNNHIG